MAIVLPDGRLNNVTDARLRTFIAERARILGVVSLHMNTFKPHTNTKTSVLFLQKWNDDAELGPLNPKSDDYQVFMAISGNGGRTSNGTYIVEHEDDGNIRLDASGHPVVRHDLNRISEDFGTFARAQGFHFAQGR